MIWTIILISTGVLGIYLAGSKHSAIRLTGWLFYSSNEILWLAYALVTHDTPLAVMACVWFAVGLRNIATTYRQERA